MLISSAMVHAAHDAATPALCPKSAPNSPSEAQVTELVAQLRAALTGFQASNELNIALKEQVAHLQVQVQQMSAENKSLQKQLIRAETTILHQDEELAHWERKSCMPVNDLRTSEAAPAQTETTADDGLLTEAEILAMWGQGARLRPANAPFFRGLRYPFPLSGPGRRVAARN
jgi:hypothetical protein